jgi:hypothetical protein
VAYNPELSDCATAAICEYLSDSTSALFRHNDYGCDSREEVEESCIYLVTDERDAGSVIRLYPNPVRNILNLHNETVDGFIHLYIYNHFGQLLMERELEGNTLDISHLPAGIYLVHIKSGNGLYSEKIVIL